MRRKIVLAVFSILILLSISGLAAQGGAPLVAFTNNAGQVIIASGDGAYRWIVTNPGERLAAPLGYSWSPDGTRLFFAVDQGADVSLRVAEPASQSAREFARIGNVSLSGGEWLNNNSVIVSAGGTINAYNLNGSATALTPVIGSVRSPYVNDRPHLPEARSASPNGSALLFVAQDGRYALQQINGSSFTIELSNDVDAPLSGLWSPDGALVAFWGYTASGTSAIAVSSAASGETLTLDSGRAAPITPVGWQPGTSTLLYRDATGFIRSADVSCLRGGCGGANPLESGAETLPATASDVQFMENVAVYMDGNQVLACPLPGNCASSGGSLIGGNVQPRTILEVNDGGLVYTSNGMITACVSNVAACPLTTVTRGTAGLLSDNGRYAVIEQGSSLFAVDLSGGLEVSLSDGGGGLLQSRWN